MAKAKGRKLRCQECGEKINSRISFAGGKVLCQRCFLYCGHELSGKIKVVKVRNKCLGVLK